MSAKFTRLSPPARAACAAAAVLVNGVLAAAVLGMFHSSSNRPWSPASAELLAATARCKTLPGRSEQLNCIDATVAAFQNPNRRILVAWQP